MVTYSPASSVLNADQMEKIKRINAEVGCIKLHNLADLAEEVMRIQGKEGIKIPANGFRSKFKPEMLDAPMKKFMEPKIFQPDRKRLTSAVSRVRRQLKGVGLVRPLGLEVAFEKILNGKETKSAGLPTLGRKVDDTGALERARACWCGKSPPPAVIGHRGKNEHVARAVWMFPFEWHIVEAAFFYPLQEGMKANVRTYASDNGVARRCQINNLVASGDYGSKIAMDYSGYDASLGPQMIGIAFGLLEEHIDFPDEKHRKVWSRIATYFATCPVVDQHLQLIKGRRGGVPSGSMFTQLIDSILNALVIEYAYPVEVQKKYLVYGDDSLILTDWTLEQAKVNLSDIRSRAREIGVTVNLEKTHICAPCAVTSFLGHSDLRRGRPLEEVLVRLIYPERPFAVTAESIQDRIAAYLAESDEAGAILVPMWFIVNRLGLNWKGHDIRAVVESYMSGLTEVKIQGSRHASNVRNLPGLQMYLATVDPTYATSYWRMRAAL